MGLSVTQELASPRGRAVTATCGSTGLCGPGGAEAGKPRAVHHPFLGEVQRESFSCPVRRGRACLEGWPRRLVEGHLCLCQPWPRPVVQPCLPSSSPHRLGPQLGCDVGDLGSRLGSGMTVWNRAHSRPLRDEQLCRSHTLASPRDRSCSLGARSAAAGRDSVRPPGCAEPARAPSRHVLFQPSRALLGSALWPPAGAVALTDCHRSFLTHSLGKRFSVHELCVRSRPACQVVTVLRSRA